jgi:O-antigen ligase
VSSVADGKNQDVMIINILAVLVGLCFLSLSVGTAPLTACSLAALSLWLLSGTCYRDRTAWMGQSWALPVLLLALLPWIGLTWSPSPGSALKFAERSHYWLFAFVAATALKSERHLRLVIMAFITGVGVSAVVVQLYSFGVIPGTFFLTGNATKGYITFSLLIVAAILFAARFYKDSFSTVNRLLYGLFIVFLACTLSSLSGRSGYLALLAVSPWVLLTMFGRRSIVPAVIAVLVTMALLFSSGRVQQRMSEIPQEIRQYQSGVRDKDKSIIARFMMWEDAVNIFRNNPVMGIGTGGYEYETKRLHPGYSFAHPHNSYLYIAANYGILGIGLYGWLVLVTFRRGLRAGNSFAGYTIVAFLSVLLIGSLTDTTILSAATGILLGFVTGIPTGTECTS